MRSYEPHPDYIPSGYIRIFNAHDDVLRRRLDAMSRFMQKLMKNEYGAISSHLVFPPKNLSVLPSDPEKK
jgi:hypothetical protein